MIAITETESFAEMTLTTTTTSTPATTTAATTPTEGMSAKIRRKSARARTTHTSNAARISHKHRTTYKLLQNSLEKRRKYPAEEKNNYHVENTLKVQINWSKTQTAVGYGVPYRCNDIACKVNVSAFGLCVGSFVRSYVVVIVVSVLLLLLLNWLGVFSLIFGIPRHAAPTASEFADRYASPRRSTALSNSLA